MAPGKAYGEDQEYQKLCRDIICALQLHENLIPYSKDGVDISFQICGTSVTFDVALKNPNGKLLVLECKRWKYPIKRNEIASFAFDIECLRKELHTEVAGIFITNSRYQIGAIKMATYIGIEIAVCKQNQSPKKFVVSYKHYSKERETVIQKINVNRTGTVQPTGTLSVRVIRADGSIEDLGKLKKL